MKSSLIRGFCRRFCLPAPLVETNLGFLCRMPFGPCKFVETNINANTGHLVVSPPGIGIKHLYDLSAAKTKLVSSKLTLYIGSLCVKFASSYHADNCKNPNPILRRPYLEVHVDDDFRRKLWALDGPVGIAYRDVLAGRACKEQFVDWLQETGELSL